MHTIFKITTVALAALIGGYCIGRAQKNTVNVFVTKTAHLPSTIQEICNEVDDVEDNSTDKD